MKVKAAVLYEVNQPIVVEEVDVDGPKAGEVLVKIAATGVCHSCYSVITGKEKWPLPAVLGDEGAGVVEAVGSGVSLVKPGDHVVLSISPACGHCIYCVRGYASLCLKAAQMRERPRAIAKMERASTNSPSLPLPNIRSSPKKPRSRLTRISRSIRQPYVVVASSPAWVAWPTQRR